MRELAKSAADLIALLLVLPALALYALGRIALGADRAFPGWSQALSLVPGLTGVYLRRAFYRRTLARCAPDCCLSFGTVFAHPAAEVGRRVYTGIGCCLGAVTIEDDVLLASHVSVANGGSQHGIDRLDVPSRDQPGTWQAVTVGRGSWIGERAVVLADVGRHCVVGAGAVVTRPIPDYAVAAGIPARVLRFRTGAPEPETNTADAVEEGSAARTS
jgi:acetyltransferase-like isoleucine patch superfamily enzyme